MIFTNILQKMLKLLKLKFMNYNAIPLIARYQKEKNKNVIRLMKDELGGKIMKSFFGLRAKIHSYLIDDGSEDKKAKGIR